MKKGKFKILVSNGKKVVEVSGYDELPELPQAFVSKDFSVTWVVYDKMTGFKLGSGASRTKAIANAIITIASAVKLHPYEWYQERTTSFYTDIEFPLNK